MSEKIYHDREWFLQKFIFDGLTLYELAGLCKADWKTLDDWRKQHGLPKHKDRQEIISIFGQEVYDNLVKRKSARYSKSNKEKAKRGKLEVIYGPDKAREIVERRTEKVRGTKRSQDFKQHLSTIRKGANNPGFKGGFHSKHVYPQIDRVAVSVHVVDIWNRQVVVENGFKCQNCGEVTISCEAHHLLSFSKIFGTVCEYLKAKNKLDTLSVIFELYNFHKKNKDVLYDCLCGECHKNAHRWQNSKHRQEIENNLMYLLQPYERGSIHVSP